MIATILGGIGIFLIGMILMTDGLKSLGGDTLRRVLTHFTGGTISGIASGFVVTSLVQASSATILATIGFVSAGLIGFNRVIAIIFGANLGTTSTGWLVSLLGFKLSPSIWNEVILCFGCRILYLRAYRLPQLSLPVEVCISANPGCFAEFLDALATFYPSLYRLRPLR